MRFSIEASGEYPESPTAKTSICSEILDRMEAYGFTHVQVLVRDEAPQISMTAARPHVKEAFERYDAALAKARGEKQ